MSAGDLREVLQHGRPRGPSGAQPDPGARAHAALALGEAGIRGQSAWADLQQIIVHGADAAHAREMKQRGLIEDSPASSVAEEHASVLEYWARRARLGLGLDALGKPVTLRDTTCLDGRPQRRNAGLVGSGRVLPVAGRLLSGPAARTRWGRRILGPIRTRHVRVWPIPKLLDRPEAHPWRVSERTRSSRALLRLGPGGLSGGRGPRHRLDR